MRWLVETVQSCTPCPLCIDSPNPDALREALEAYDPRHGAPIVNSITAEPDRYRRLISVVLRHGAKVVALAMDDSGIQADGAVRSLIARNLVARLAADGVPLADVYLDPMTFPIAGGEGSARALLKLIGEVKAEFPGVHTIAGLSNVSHGLPNRKLVNWAMTVLAIGAGLDAAILDPNDRTLMALVASAEVLTDRDEYCMGYIEACRSGRFDGV